MLKQKIEIMSPAGSFESLTAAIQGGANSVYFGIGQLNMRARAANNFTKDDLPEIVKICNEKKVRTYLTINTILYDHDLTLMKSICDTAKQAGVTAVIASDIAAIQYAHSIGLEIHISTQLNVTNMEAIRFYAKFADVVVLARELTLNQIKHICETIEKQDIKGASDKRLEIEIFAHGALCVAISGKCYMSLATYNSSANRGACLQNCRRAYRVIDEETGDELKIDNKYIMSPKDLCTIGFINKILDAGVAVLKLEGRGRPADYVYTVTKAYREAADSVLDGTYTKEKIDKWTKDLESVFNRGLWHGGYYMGKKLGEWSGEYGSQATKEKEYLGKVIHYFDKAKVGEFIIETGKLRIGDEIMVIGDKTGVMKTKIESLRLDESPVQSVKKGDSQVTIEVADKVRKNDKLFKIITRNT